MLALAQHLREDDGAGFVGAEHMREAIRQLDLDVEEREVGDSPTGRDF